MTETGSAGLWQAVPLPRLFRAGIIAGVAALALIVAASAFAAYQYWAGNFHEVLAGELYRSAQLTPMQFQAYRDRYKIRSILNLRGANPGSEWYRAEARTAAADGVTLIDFKMSARRELEPAQAADLIALMVAAPKPLLVHCKSGADRTGLAVALYLASAKKVEEGTAEAQMALYTGTFHRPTRPTLPWTEVSRPWSRASVTAAPEPRGLLQDDRQSRLFARTAAARIAFGCAGQIARKWRLAAGIVAAEPRPPTSISHAPPCAELRLEFGRKVECKLEQGRCARHERTARRDPMRVVFRCDPMLAPHLPRPVAARTVLPDWLRAMPAGVFSEVHQREIRTVKHCPPFVDAMAYGFMILLPCDVRVDDRALSWEWPVPEPATPRHPRAPISFHVPEQLRGSPVARGGAALKFNSFWTIELEEGWSLFCTHPANRDDLPFRLMTGLVDADRFHDGGINFPAVWIDDSFAGVLQRGTPVAQCFPVPRTALSLAFELLDGEHREKYSATVSKS